MTQTTTSSPTSSTSARKSSKGGKHNKRRLILQPLMFEPVNTYLLTERGNPNYQSVLVREYFTPKLHRRLLVGRFVNQMWAWDDSHHYWIRLKVRSLLSPAMKNKYIRQAYPLVDVTREIEGKTIHESIYCHRLMAAVWCPNPDPEHRTQVDHLNGDINDYSQFNLEWVTPEENIRRAVAMRRARKKQLTN